MWLRKEQSVGDQSFIYHWGDEMWGTNQWELIVHVLSPMRVGTVVATLVFQVSVY
jgi:hypothetical protein